MDSVLLQAQRHPRARRTTSTRSAAGPARAGSASSSDPFQARKVINEGKLAVVHRHRGLRAVRLRAQTQRASRSAPRPQIDRWLDQLYELGVRQLEIIEQVRQRAHRRRRRQRRRPARSSTAANFLATGKFWDLEPCADPEQPRPRAHRHQRPHNDDLIIANGLDEPACPAARCPVYPDGAALQPAWASPSSASTRSARSWTAR